MLAWGTAAEPLGTLGPARFLFGVFCFPWLRKLLRELGLCSQRPASFLLFEWSCWAVFREVPFVAFLSQDVVCNRFRQTVCLCFPSLVHTQEAFRTTGSNGLEQLPEWACFNFSLMTFIVLIAVFRGHRVYMLIIEHLKNVEKEYG